MREPSFQVGSPINWRYDHFSLNGIVIKVDGNKAIVAPVLGLERGMRCYDEQGSVYETDRDHISLRDHPDIFKLLRSKVGRHECCAMGAEEAWIKFQLQTGPENQVQDV